MRLLNKRANRHSTGHSNFRRAIQLMSGPNERRYNENNEFGGLNKKRVKTIARIRKQC